MLYRTSGWPYVMVLVPAPSESPVVGLVVSVCAWLLPQLVSLAVSIVVFLVPMSVYGSNRCPSGSSGVS